MQHASGVQWILVQHYWGFWCFIHALTVCYVQPLGMALMCDKWTFMSWSSSLLVEYWYIKPLAKMMVKTIFFGYSKFDSYFGMNEELLIWVAVIFATVWINAITLLFNQKATPIQQANISNRSFIEIECIQQNTCFHMLEIIESWGFLDKKVKLGFFFSS